MIPSKPPADQYTDLYRSYIDLVAGDVDLLTILDRQHKEILQCFSALPADKADYRYAPGKWSVKELLMHMVDAERYMSFKSFVTMRGDKETVLHHMNREVYLENAVVAQKTISSILQEFTAVRQATIALFRSIPEGKEGLVANHANPRHAISAAALGYAIAGHAAHHEKVLRERYIK
jgi:uncharacterized damage-inducible protein DinB